MSPIRSVRTPGADRGLISEEEGQALGQSWDELLEELAGLDHVLGAARILVEHVVDRAVQLRADLEPGSLDDPLPDYIQDPK